MVEEGSKKKPLKTALGDIIFETNPGWSQRFDTILLVVIVLSVIAVMLESVVGFRERYGTALVIAEWGFTALFTIEYVIRLWVARKRLRYIFSFFGMVDLLSLLPSFLSLVIAGSQSLLIIRILRLLRVFRVLKLVRFSKEAAGLATALRGSLAKITVFIGAVLLLAVLMGALMYLIEGADSGFDSIPHSVYWAIVTVTTVGFGDITPSTPLGQGVASLLMIFGYGIIAVPTGIVSAELISAQKVRRKCTSCPVGQHAMDSTFCRACGSVLELSAIADS